MVRHAVRAGARPLPRVSGAHRLQKESQVIRAGSAELAQRAAIRKKSCVFGLLTSTFSTYEI